MASDKIEGARRIGQTWHYYKRIPKRLQKTYGLPEFRRGTMGTTDSTKARQLARAMLTELDELESKLDSVASRLRHFDRLTEAEQESVVSEAETNVAALPHDQRQLVQASGGVFAAGRDMKRHEVTAAFLTTGNDAEYELKDDTGEGFDPEEREEAETLQAASAAMHDRKVARCGSRWRLPR